MRSATDSARWLYYAGFAGLLLIMITGNRDFFYDEHFYIDNVKLLNTYGLSGSYLRLHKASAGITQTLVQWAFQPVTQLIPFRTRMVNVMLLAAVVWLLNKLVASRTHERFAGSWMLALPMTYVCAGMTLSEMPALFFLVSALLCRTRYLTPDVTGTQRIVMFLLSAACMSLAVLGRQPYLPVVFLFPLLAFEKKRFPSFCVWILIVLLPCVPVFYVWGGLVPKTDGALYTELIGKGEIFMPSHMLLYFFYAGICMLILAPSFFSRAEKRPWLIPLASVLVTGLLSRATGMLDFLPARGLMMKIFAYVPFSAGIAGIVIPGIVITAAAWMIWSLCVNGWKRRHEPFFLFNAAAIIAIGITCGFVTLQFNSRYTFQAAPFLLMLAARNGLTVRGLSWLGMIAGLLSLYAYYFLT